MPKNPDYDYFFSVPKTNVWLGYTSTDEKAGWIFEQSNVFIHPTARFYMKPAAGGTCPNFMIEMKTDSISETFRQAENQVAGSGAHFVNALIFPTIAGSHPVHRKIAMTAEVKQTI